jgi:malic enzyme
MTKFEHMIDEYEQHEQNLIDFEDSRFGDIYLEDERVARKAETKRKQRKMKKEKDYV